MPAKALNVLMTGAGAPGAPGIIKCLLSDPSINLLVADADPNAIGRYLHHQFIQVPMADDPQYTDKLLEICRDKKIDILLPLVTKELFPLSINKQAFELQGTKVLVSSAEAIRISNDKSACYRFLQTKGLELPGFHIARTTEEFIHAAYELGHPQRSFCFKPSLSNGSRGFRVVSDSINESDELFKNKPFTVFITYAHALKILSSQAFPELLVTEYLPAEEYSIDCLAQNGETKLIVPRRRTKMINGISVQGHFVNDNDIIDYCTRLISLIGLHGNIGIQLKRSASGKPLLVEANPRVQGTIVAALGAGVNLPLLAIKQEIGLSIDPSELNVKWGTRFSRYWTEVFY
jgi:carbamoyl-phosphate synthase large subunit